MREGLEVEGRGPGVVGDDHGSGRVRGFSDRRQVLDLEGDRARALAEHDPGLGPDQLSDAMADQGVVVGGLDAEAAQRVVGEASGRGVDGIDDEQVVAGLEQGQEGRGDGGLAGADHEGVEAAFQPGQRILEGMAGGRAVAAVIDAAMWPCRFQGRDGREQHGRGVVDGRVDDPVLLFGRAPERGDEGGVVHRGRTRARLWV